MKGNEITSLDTISISSPFRVKQGNGTVSVYIESDKYFALGLETLEKEFTNDIIHCLDEFTDIIYIIEGTMLIMVGPSRAVYVGGWNKFREDVLAMLLLEESKNE